MLKIDQKLVKIFENQWKVVSKIQKKILKKLWKIYESRPKIIKTSWKSVENWPKIVKNPGKLNKKLIKNGQ